MRKLFLSIAVFVMALCANAQTNQYFWYQGNLMLGNPIAQIDSVTFGEGEPADTLHILLPRTIIKEVHDTVYITIHDTVCPNALPEGALAGEFSVSEIKKVRFSKGNLQYQASTDTWRFAENQWDYVGDQTNGTVYENEIKCNNSLISPTCNGWIDLFGWGTGNNPTLTSNNNSDYSTFVDWGVNPISNGGNESNVWRTITYAELNYLFKTRANALSLRGRAMVNGIKVYILLPDDWSAPEDVIFIANKSDWTSNIFTEEDWSKMESNGAVLFPYAGRRVGTGATIDNPGIRGHYSSSTPYDEQRAGVLYFDDDLNIGYDYRYYGLTVRLIQDVE